MALKQFLSGPWQNASVSSTLGLGNSCGRQAWGDQVILSGDCPVSTNLSWKHGRLVWGIPLKVKHAACMLQMQDLDLGSRFCDFGFLPTHLSLIHSAGWSAISGLFIVYIGLHDTHIQHSLLKALGMGILYTSVTMSVCYLKKTSD